MQGGRYYHGECAVCNSYGRTCEGAPYDEIVDFDEIEPFIIDIEEDFDRHPPCEDCEICQYKNQCWKDIDDLNEKLEAPFREQFDKPIPEGCIFCSDCFECPLQDDCKIRKAETPVE